MIEPNTKRKEEKLGVDYSEDGDYSVTAYGKRYKNGRIKITRFVKMTSPNTKLKREMILGNGKKVIVTCLGEKQSPTERWAEYIIKELRKKNPLRMKKYYESKVDAGYDIGWSACIDELERMLKVRK